MSDPDRPTPTASLPRLLPVEEVAAWLGITPRGVRALLQRNELPSFRLGRRRYCLTEDVERAIKGKVAENTTSRASSAVAGRILAGLPAYPKGRALR